MMYNHLMLAVKKNYSYVCMEHRTWVMLWVMQVVYPFLYHPCTSWCSIKKCIRNYTFQRLRISNFNWIFLFLAERGRRASYLVSYLNIVQVFNFFKQT